MLITSQADITDKLHRIMLYLTQAQAAPADLRPQQQLMWWSDYDYAAQIVGTAARYSLYFDVMSRPDWERFTVKVWPATPPRCGGWHAGQQRRRTA